MSMQSRPSDEFDRRRFVADAGVLAELGVSVEELGDPEIRSRVVRHEHPEFDQALQNGLDEIVVGDAPINPRLHFAMHEIVAAQLWDDEPPEVWETAVRLLRAGYERHEVLHMLGRSVSDQIWAALHDEASYDRDRHVAGLRALPGSWERERERERTALAGTKRHEEARKQARRQAQAARRRNRRPS